MYHLPHGRRCANEVTPEHNTVWLFLNKIHIDDVGGGTVYTDEFATLVLAIINAFRISFGPKPVDIAIFKNPLMVRPFTWFVIHFSNLFYRQCIFKTKSRLGFLC